MIVLDIETSGVDPSVHSILSIGAIDFNNPVDQFSGRCRLWSGAKVMPEALAVNGFTEAEIKDYDLLSETTLVERFLEWAGQVTDHTVAGMNPHFDLGFIEQACRRGRLNFPLSERLVDLHAVCLFHMIRAGLSPQIEKGRSSLNSDAVCQYVGLPAESKPHLALSGAKWEAEAFQRLFFDQNLLEEFAGYPIPWLD